jgi:flagellar basal body-associated protein FliL
MTISPEPAPAPAFMEPPARPKRRRKIIVIVIAAVIALIVAGGLGIYLVVDQSTKDAQKVSDQLVAAVQEGDGPAAYALTGPSFRAATTEAQLSELVKNLSTVVTRDTSSAKQKAISVSTDNGKIAVFVYTMKGTGGGPIYFKTQIREEDGRWQVMSFRSSESKLSADIE